VSAVLITGAAVLCAISGLPALTAPRGSRAACRISTALLMIAGAIGLIGAGLGLAGPTTTLSAPWAIPGGALRIRVDALSAFFAAPVFLLAAVGALYGEGYWPASRRRAGYVRFFYGLLAGGLAIVMTAHNLLLFLMAWEIVAVSAYFVVVTLDDDEAVRSAAWLYLIASHVSVLALFALVGVLHAVTGSWDLVALPAGTALTAGGQAICWLALIGFGIKAGLMPFNVWLPGAHAGAPSHVSAIMSGVVIKMGVYGIVRVLTLFDAPPGWFGGTLLVFGLVSSIFGVAFALAQHDLKRLLAYHSIENIGIIVTGLGVGVVAQTHGYPTIAFLGYAGALLHVWNHSLFKALLFLGAGSAIHAADTREIDRMGGLARQMPWTAASFLTGAVAICGLPPLNGFVSEWLLYLGSFASVQKVEAGWVSPALVVVAPALALTGALALACFVKAFGAVFLGEARSAAASRAHEAPRSMRWAMLPLAVACFAIGLLPRTIAPVIDRAVAATSGLHGTVTTALAPLQTMAIVLAAVAAAAVLLLKVRVGNAPRNVTWDCGYVAPTARMQYTSSSFARGLVGYFAWAMPPVVHEPQHLPLFPTEARLETHVPDTVLDRLLIPLSDRIRRTLMIARHIQSGRMQAYLLYIGATLLVLLFWSAL
jgi:hydrogenase-4 component B